MSRSEVRIFARCCSPSTVGHILAGTHSRSGRPRRQAKSLRAQGESEEFHALLQIGLALGRRSRDCAGNGYSGKVARVHLELLTGGAPR